MISYQKPPEMIGDSAYRWNPFLKRWEFWYDELECWIESFFLNEGRIDFGIYISYYVVSFEDTWCEPTKEDIYEWLKKKN